jgi:Na+:H+ antiporter, NhaC family
MADSQPAERDPVEHIPGLPRAPSMRDALIPLVSLIALIALTVVTFGVDATAGPLQVALLVAASIAALVAFKNGHTVAYVRDAAIGGVSSGMGALFILLAVGALIGTWNMAGTIPTIVYYGIGLLSATWFYAATAVVCALIGLAIGSSWTTAATVGVALVAMAPLLGASPVIAAGAVISGAYFGDKMTPISETTILVPSLVGGVSTNEHIGAMVWTSGVAFAIAVVLFAVLGFAVPPAAVTIDPADAQAVLAGEFWITPLNLLPMLLLVLLSVRQVPPFLAILGSAIFAGFMALITQPGTVSAFVDRPDAGPIATAVAALFASMGTGFVSSTGNESVDALFSGGGMDSMLTTIWLVLAALAFGAIMEHAGFLERLIRPVVEWADSTGQLIAAVVFTSIGLNVVAGDQYVADVLPSRVYRTEFAKRGLAPRMLSRAVEDSGTVTSPLVPWNTCGAYMSGVLGIATGEYFIYCFFNLLSPVISLFYGFTGIRIEHVRPPSGTAGPERAPERRPVAPQRRPV